MNAVTWTPKASAPSATPPLNIGRPDDAFEEGADRATDEVMNCEGSAARWSLQAPASRRPRGAKLLARAEMSPAPAIVLRCTR
jgi:hypothetical protein